jgi:hypothetical protein
MPKTAMLPIRARELLSRRPGLRRLSVGAALGMAACSSPSPPTAAPTTFSAACLHYASHLTGGQCGNPALPAAEVERVTPRWAQHCEDVLSLPGSLLTASALDQCLTLLEAGDCWSANPPDICMSAGTLAANAACNQFGVQCQSGACLGTIAQAPCGTCVPPVTLGQACDPNLTANLCVIGSVCAPDATGSSCTALTLKPLNAPCTASSDCATGLICDATALVCAKPPGAGAPCSDPFSCEYPLVCNVTETAGTTCQPAGAAGAPCLNDEFCTKGLGCSNAGGTCGPITWKNAGEPCDGDLARCLVGTCPPVQAPVCPTIIADGAACSADDVTQTCDVGAVCFSGKCTTGTKVACN